ncbi:hypothetical protein, partial [Paenibacillus sp. Marseille-Q4541]|uniref:hypothetical protein n=1 Tax=Paenibacillus sp. Marseille-Q4541 TaxID=2831522 RepID=UPI001BA9E708
KDENMKLQLTELQYLALMILMPIIILFVVILNLIGFIITIGLLIVLSCIFPLIIKFKSRKYGGGIIYNKWFKVIEFHLNRTSDWSDFALEVAKVRRLSKRTKIAILFYTDHYEETRLIEMGKKLKLNMEVKRANLFQKLVYLFTSFIATIGKKRERKGDVLRCIARPFKD